MATSMYVVLDKSDLKALNKALNGSQKAVQKALKNAVNRAATQAKQELRTEESEQYTLKRSRYYSQLKTVKRAKNADPTAVIKSSGRPHTSLNVRAGATKRAGGRIDNLRSGYKAVESSIGGKSFKATSGSANKMLVQRTSKERYPLKVMQTPSSPKITEMLITGERGSGNLKETIQQKLHDEIMAEIKKAV